MLSNKWKVRCRLLMGHLVEHPDDDEAELVGGGELLVRLVPGNHLPNSMVVFRNQLERTLVVSR